MVDASKFLGLVAAATAAPSSDNMQPWEFCLSGDRIEVSIARHRLLAVDARDMFSWISIGAAIQNMVERAAEMGLAASVEYPAIRQEDDPVAVVSFAPGATKGFLSASIASRTTNRGPFRPRSLSDEDVAGLSSSVEGMGASVHWLRDDRGVQSLADMDTVFSSILLSHKPLFDGLFDTVRFTKREMEEHRCGMDVRSLDLPAFAAFLVKRFKRLDFNRAMSRLGIGPVVARILSSRLKKSGGICLFAVDDLDPAGFMEGGRAMERLWLAAAAAGMSVHPYGVIPQYLAMAEFEPGRFPPEKVETILANREPFASLFPGASGKRPVIMLRVGRSRRQSARTTIRLLPEQVIRA